jgi:hypothetical protein
MDDIPPLPSRTRRHRVIHVTCPECDSPKAVVAHTHFREIACFCPACEHVWHCDASVLGSTSE